MERVEIVELEFPDGEVGYAEIAVPAGGDVIFRKCRFELAKLGPQIQRLTRWLVTEVEEALPGRPQKVGLEFGLKLSAETGRFIGALAKAGADATVVVKIEWNPAEAGTA